MPVVARVHVARPCKISQTGRIPSGISRHVFDLTTHVFRWSRPLLTKGTSSGPTRPSWAASSRRGQGALLQRERVRLPARGLLAVPPRVYCRARRLHAHRGSLLRGRARRAALALGTRLRSRKLRQQRASRLPARQLQLPARRACPTYSLFHSKPFKLYRSCHVANFFSGASDQCAVHNTAPPAAGLDSGCASFRSL